MPHAVKMPFHCGASIFPTFIGMLWLVEERLRP